MNNPEDMIKTLGLILMPQEQMTYAQVDQRFLDELETLKLNEAEKERAFNLWLCMTDHVVENRRPLTADEAGFLFGLFERIVFRNGFGRVVMWKGN